MNRSESKYFRTAERMDEALFSLIERKDLEFITVKEICRVAGVNRSTFYLHYETVEDLLDECSEYLMRRFEKHFSEVLETRARDIREAPLEELNFITPEYLLPYLRFVRENARFFQTVVVHSRLFGSEKHAESLFRDLFFPILQRYRYPEQIQRYVLLYYLRGMMAVITEWIRNGMQETPEEMAEIIRRCVIPHEIRN